MITLQFGHLKLLVQLHDSPLLASSINGRRVIACEELLRLGLIYRDHTRYMISKNGEAAIDSMVDFLNQYTKQQENGE